MTNSSTSISDMKKEHGAKLLAYSGMAVAYLSVQSLHAQVYYTDLSPDEQVGAALPQDEFLIDLNEDGVDDVRLFGINGGNSIAGYSAIMVEGINPAGINGCFIATSYINSISDYGGAMALTNSETVEEDLYFGSATATVLRQNWSPAGSSSSGVWAPGTSAALGLRLDVSGGSYYGWIKCQLTDASQITVLDYMLNADPSIQLSVNEPPPPPCTPPTGLTATVLAPNQVQLDWNPVPNAEKYQLKGRIPGSVFASKITNSNSQIVSVSPGAVYEWKVRARCFGGESTGFSPASFFSTPTPRLSGVALTEELITETTSKPQFKTADGAAAISDILVFADNGKLSINSLRNPIQQVRLIDLSGRTAMQFDDRFSFRDFDLSHLPQGIYILSVLHESGHYTQKLHVD